jgi:hypothetical protein
VPEEVKIKATSSLGSRLVGLKPGSKVPASISLSKFSTSSNGFGVVKNDVDGKKILQLENIS